MDLRLDLGGTDFDDLVELGRASIPGLAPAWTDHNIHDPGIMLMELIAWVADAQIYSVARTRRDERMAYARLLGVPQRPPQPARALIWPLDADEGDDGDLFSGVVLPAGTRIAADRPDPPQYRLGLTGSVLLTGAQLRQLRSRAGGAVVDHTRANRRNGTSYTPFAASPGPDDRLVLTLRDAARRTNFAAGPILLGVESAEPASIDPDGHPATTNAPPLRVSVRDSAGERPVAIGQDTTRALARTGYLLLDLGDAAPIDADFEIILRPPRSGFLQTPRLRRVGLNVLPAEQVETMSEEEPAFGDGLPDQAYPLGRGGGVSPLSVTLIERDGPQAWSQVDDLSACGPDDRVFAFDPDEGELRFGNGLNGKAPPDGAALQVTYDVSWGMRGNLPAGLGWRLRGFAGVFGLNDAPAGGGRDADTLDDLQPQARLAATTPSANITGADLADAALNLEDLGVARAIEVGVAKSGRRGVRTLLAAATDAESPTWLAAVRRRLAPTLPLGQRLEVVAPDRVDVRIRARLVAEPGANLADVEQAAKDELNRRLVTTGPNAWPFGRDLSAVVIRGWLRDVYGVLRVAEVRLQRSSGAPVERVALGPRELPQFRLEAGDVAIEPWRGGSSS